MCLFSKPPVSVYEPPENITSMTRGEVIEKMEEDILIHEYWAVKVTQEPKYAPSMGDYDWHMMWIEVYQNTIYYLEGRE